MGKVCDDRLLALDGFRAIVHLSLIALHTAMLTSGHLPSDGPSWLGMKKNLVYSVFQAGGTQVDLMFMLSAYLLVHKLLVEFDGNKPTLSLSTFAFRRALRFIPSILAVSVIGYILGDTWDGAVDRGEVSPLGRVLAFITFVANYIPPSVVGCFTLSLCWSCCVDLHAGVLISFIVFVAKKGLKSTQSSTLAYRLRWVFLLLTCVSLGIRAVLFEKDSLNLFKLGQYSHFGLLMTDSSYAWIQQFYGHKWMTKNTQVELSQGYMTNMYNPTHTRIGPFFVGGVVACSVFLATKDPPKVKKTLLGTITSWLFTLQALATLVVPCLPPEDDVPLIGQHIATAALRTLSAAAAGLLLYRATVPRGHNWHWSALNSLLSFRALAPVATLSYCSYLIHFRILMELNFRPSIHKWLLDLPPVSFLNHGGPAEKYIMYLPKLFVLAAACSLLASTVLYHAVEKPAARAISGWVTGNTSKGRKGAMNTAVSNSDLLKTN